MPKTSYEETMWMIAGPCGLYTGAELRRSAAIEEHVKAIYGDRFTKKEAWARRKRQGDRAVKVRIIYEA